MPVHFDSVFVTSTGAFLPGEPVDNDDLDRYIAPLNAASARIKRRILAENGIRRATTPSPSDGTTQHSPHRWRPRRSASCLDRQRDAAGGLIVLCTGTSGGDLAMPGFANMVQGELQAPAHAYEQSSGGVRVWRRRAAARSEHDRAGRCRPRAGRHERVAVAHVQALAVRAARLRNRLRRTLPALDAVRRRWRLPAEPSPSARDVAEAEVDPQPLVQRRSAGVHADRPAAGRQQVYLDYPSLAKPKPRRLPAAPGHPPAAASVRARHSRVRRARPRAVSLPSRSITSCATTRRRNSPAWSRS